LRREKTIILPQNGLFHQWLCQLRPKIALQFAKL